MMADFLVDFLERPGVINAVIAAAALAVLLIIAAKYLAHAWRAALSDYAICLLNKSDSGEIARILAPMTPPDHYRAGLVTAEGLMRRMLGGAWSWRLLNTCLLTAFVAPVLLFSLAWLAGGGARLGGLDVFPELPGFAERAGKLGLTIAFTCGLLLFGSQFENGLSALKRMMSDVTGAVGRAAVAQQRRPSHRMAGTKAGALEIIGAALIALFFALTFAAAVGFAIYMAVSSSLVLAFVLSLAVALAFAFSPAFSAAFCGASLGALFYAVAGAAPVEALPPGLLMAFFLALPAPLCLALYISWSATLSLLGSMTHLSAGWRAAMPLPLMTMATLAIAVGGMALHAALSGIAFDAANLLLEARNIPLLDWRRDIAQALAGPLSAPAAWLPAGMAALAPAPAALAIVYGISAMLLAMSPDRAAAAAMLKSGERPSPRQRGEAAIRLARLDFLRAPARLMVTAAGLALSLIMLEGPLAGAAEGLGAIARAAGLALGL